ncbi:MAG: formimidoylglutamase [Bacteroidetes bacterium]|nr:formimidoylglutamase [Bacteroidota bacterium]
MEWLDFLEPVNSLAFGTDKQSGLGNQLLKYSEAGTLNFELKDVQIAIVGIEDDRAAVNNEGASKGANVVRKYLYDLCPGNYTIKIADFGNIKRGFEINDTYFAVTEVAYNLIKNNILPVFIGGGQDLTYAIYKAYEKIGHTINLTAIDPNFDIGEVESELNSRTYLGKIIMQQPNYLFNFSNIGYQTYFVEQRILELMNKLYFDTYRLGEIRANIESIEPIIRNSDVISFDLSSIRYSDAPGCKNATPNGFYGEEACQLAWYAGMNDKLSSIGFFEYNPTVDKREVTAHLVAQMIWCFIDGFYSRKNDQPLLDTTSFIKYRVPILNAKHEISFFKSTKSDRWWMQVPYPTDKKLKYERHHLVPCSYNDYLIACNEEMPDRWWQTYQKLF